MSSSSGLFQVPREHVAELEEVKKAVGVHHHYLDGWIYLFLSNKKFDIKETIAKLHRRDDMERTVFAKYTITDTLRASMRAGIVQYIGRDRDGHPVLYFNTVRDSPKADQRPERQANMDMFLSWAVRCDKHNPTAMVTWLINQKNASMLRNTDLIFQKDMALRISKFFPGVLGRMYICNMSGALTFVMKPLLRQLPSSISDCIFLFSASDIRNGELQKHIDPSVLPVEMGGQNNCDNQPNYERFATTIEGYFERCIQALGNGLSIKQMEMMDEFGVDKDGNLPLAPAATTAATKTGASPSHANGVQMQESVVPRARMASAASEETLDHTTIQDPVTVTVDAATQKITVQSVTLRRKSDGAAEDGPTNASTVLDWNMSFASPPVPSESLLHRVPSSVLMDCVSVTGFSMEDSINSPVAKSGLYKIELTRLDEFSFSSVMRKVYAQKLTETTMAQRDACVRDWVSFCCQCVELVPKVEALLEALRRGAVFSGDDDLVTKLRRCSHHMLNLFPQTRATLPFPLLDWYAAGATARYRCAASAKSAAASGSDLAAGLGELDVFEINPRRLAFRLDCTTPDNVLLSAQAGAVEFIESWDDAIAVEQRKMRVQRRLLLTWPPHTDRSVFEAQLTARARQLWRQLCPLFRLYIESKVGIAIAEFIRHYGLLIAGGRINESSEWYQQLFTDVLQYRELHRRNWLFYVFPPISQDETLIDDPPTMAELLRARGETSPSFDAAAALMALVEQSLQYTADQLTSDGVAGVVATRTTVERYLEVSKTKIYIPYDTQRSGVLPVESIEQHKRAAVQALRDAEGPLQELLFTTASLFALQHEYPPPLTEADIKVRLQTSRAELTRAILERREHQRVAMSFTRACAELQGSFGSDVYNLLTTFSAVAVHAEGYALGLELLLAVSILRSGKEGDSGSRDRVASPTTADIVPPLSLSSEEDTSFVSSDVQLTGSRAALAAKVDVASLLETLSAMEIPAARLASLKRVYIY
uniref:CRAL-TRIO domain-containing protein n=1 Tax=Angomonas deanei TaxID=59799 RepID=C6K3U2_9TRYP|nr:conserved hypothetical protein [Angomonas deanei]